MRDADQPFLQSLYAGFRAEEMAALPWPPFQKTAFLTDQFRLQHIHFLTLFPNADFWVVERRRRPVGRLYLDRSRGMWRVIDVGFLAEARGHGLGGALLDWVQAMATGAGAEGIDLHVLTDNSGAYRLYDRLGFTAEDPAEDGRQRLVWRADPPGL